MNVQVRWFALLREFKGCSHSVHDVAPGTTIHELALQLIPASLQEKGLLRSLLYAVNQQFVGPEQVLAEGDIVAFIPPVSGG